MATDVLQLFDPISDPVEETREDENSLQNGKTGQPLTTNTEDNHKPLTNGHHNNVIGQAEESVTVEESANLESTVKNSEHLLDNHVNGTGTVESKVERSGIAINGVSDSTEGEGKHITVALSTGSNGDKEGAGRDDNETRLNGTDEPEDSKKPKEKKEKLAVKFNTLPRVYDVEKDAAELGQTIGNNPEKDLIRSDRGSVRGWTDQVRKSRAVFLGKVAESKMSPRLRRVVEEESPNEELGIKGKIVIYMTSLSAIRETYSRCCRVLEIFHNHCVVYKTKDTYLHPKYKKELRERLQNKKVTIPQVFINGLYLGDEKKVVEMNESGQLQARIIGFEKTEEDEICPTCKDRGFIMCMWCRGSKKGWKNRFGDLECTVCNKNALQKCPDCSDLFKKAKKRSED